MKDITVAKKLVSIEDSATKRGIKFNLSFRKCKRLLMTKKCYYTGAEFEDGDYLTFDRVDNDKGYTDDNVVACSKSFNEIKKNLTIDQINLLYRKVNGHGKKR